MGNSMSEFGVRLCGVETSLTGTCAIGVIYGAAPQLCAGRTGGLGCTWRTDYFLVRMA